MTDIIEQQVDSHEPNPESIESGEPDYVEEAPVEQDYVEEVNVGESLYDPNDSKGVAKRIGKLAKKLSAKDQEIAVLKEQLKNQPTIAEPTQAEQGKPKLADYDTVEEFTEALTDWKMDQRQVQAQATSQQQAKVQNYYQKVEHFQKSAPDFAVAVSEIESQLSRDPNMVEFILESDFGPQIAYHLANNEEEIARISQLSPVRRIAALSKIEVEMAQRKTKPSGNTTNKQPASRVTTNTGSIAKGDIVNKDRSFAEWRVWREQNRKK